MTNFNPPAGGQISNKGTGRKIGNFSAGFTLIELLLVAALIGIFSTFVLVNLQGFRQRARDTQRKRDLRQLQAGLELYKADQATYPSSPLPACAASLSQGGNTYIRSLPCDPLSGAAWGTSYKYSTTGNAYTLYACLENGNDTERDSSKQGGCSSAPASYTVLSP